MSYSKFSQGSIVIGNFPYSDLSQIKKRPLLIASKDEYNKNSDDVIVVKVTSVIKNRPYTIELTNDDLESGRLKKPSSIKVDSIFFISKNLLNTPIAKVKGELMDYVKNNIKSIFSIK